MNSLNTTNWFPGNINPVRVGVYQRKTYDSIVYANWDGFRWCVYSLCKEEAAKNFSPSIFQQNLPWRGLAK